MLDSVNMKTTVTKDEFKKQSKKLEKELETLPQQIKQAQIPVKEVPKAPFAAAPARPLHRN